MDCRSGKGVGLKLKVAGTLSVLRQRVEYHYFSLGVFFLPLAVKPRVSPNRNGLPGIGALEKAVGGLMTVGIVACLAWFIIGAARAGLGSRAHNYQQAADGKQQMLWGGLGAFLIAAAGAVISFAYSAGGAVR